MKSAKNGQDGVNCEQVYEACTSFKDSENPAMLTTFHEINKLVHARKLNWKLEKENRKLLSCIKMFCF